MKYLDINEITQQDYRQKQLDNAIFKQLVKDFDEIQTLPKNLREKLNKRYTFPTISLVKKAASRDKSVVKALFKTKKDKKSFEAVLLQHQDNRRTVCVSTQIGCPMNCTFCATGQMKFIRNLTYREIVDQVLYFARFLMNKEEKVTNIVYMGMGEPFLNKDNTEKSAQIINDEEQFGLGARNITVSSVGIIEPMKEFFNKYPQINLAISLHSAIQEKRENLMPIASKVSLKQLAQYINFHITKHNRRVSLEYLLIDGFNDCTEDIKALEKFLTLIGSDAQKLVHINLIPFNEIPNSDLAASPRSVITQFRRALDSKNIKATIRKSLGQKQNAACGMLKAQNK
jgi:23S rRNA (adenine2503-C2)-methyltransferase